MFEHGTSMPNTVRGNHQTPLIRNTQSDREDIKKIPAHFGFYQIDDSKYNQNVYSNQVEFKPSRLDPEEDLEENEE